MPSTISQVGAGLKTRLETITGLRAFSYQPEQLNPPTAFPVLSSVNYHRAFSGGDVETYWQIRVIVGRWTDRTAHALLDDFLSFDGAKSIRAAVEGDKTLGGVCQTLVLSSGADITSLSQEGAEFLEIQLSLTVYG
jgi:hypothetical protein